MRERPRQHRGRRQAVRFRLLDQAPVDETLDPKPKVDMFSNTNENIFKDFPDTIQVHFPILYYSMDQIVTTTKLHVP